jgi:hypothetical protein
MKRFQVAELIEQERATGMRNQNLSGSTHRRVASGLGMSGMPLEWLDAGSWRLPSGKALAEYALQAGFLVPLLFRAGTFEGESQSSGGGRAMAGAGQSPNKDTDTAKGGNR